MEYLLDTNALINIAYGKKDLNPELIIVLNNKNSRLFASDISLWEIEIKHNKYPELMPFSATQLYELLVDTDVSFLPMHLSHIARLKEIYELKIHKDPFDTLLIAMALEESMVLVTSDEKILKYPIVSTLQI